MIEKIIQFFFRKNIIPSKGDINLGVLGNGESSSGVFDFNEIVGTSSVAQFVTKPETNWRTFFFQYQFSSSACVTFTLAKIESILYFLKTGRKVKFSPGFWYAQRSNKPDLGMFFEDIQKLGTKGAVLYDLLPCEGIDEEEMDNLIIEQYHRDSAIAFALPDTWVDLPLDFDTVAATIERTGKGIMLWFRIQAGEYFRNKVPFVINGSRNVSGHSICAVDAFTYMGIQYILCEDSAEQGMPLRLITRDFFNSRAYLARYPINFKFEIGNKPAYDGTIVSAQKCLRYETFFPSNVAYAENVGKITQAALELFQKKYSLPITKSLDDLTRNKLTQLYG